MKKTSFLSKQADSLQPSGIRRFFDLAAQMEDVISLGVGEPDFVTPWSFIEHSFHSLEQGYTSYTENAGMLDLREEISNYLLGSFGVNYDAEKEIIVTVGASQAIDLALRATVNPGEEVLVVEPGFVAYVPTVSLAGGTPVTIQTRPEDDFKLTPELLEAAITPRTKAIILCNPNNPTGAALTGNELEKVAEVVEKHDLLVLSDEIYAELTYEDVHTSFPAIENMKERTVLISGFSKAFAMTGWRLGYATGPEEIIQTMVKIHQFTMMCAPTIAQHAALEAMKNGKSSVDYMIKSYKQRRNFIVSSLNEMGLSCPNPGGAFYAFPSIRETGLSSADFAEELLQEEQVAVVPGNVFGESGEGFVRCSYATSLKQLDEAMRRIKRFVDRRI
ncbi:aminotransferase [Salimicrobium jeotgali]|uniref:aminotransferase n=1 Tax=Salimicrobium jeotgali TaxID=1230341 RepID=UPI000C841E97|nr:aminotransferase [Salimicrobium jeotgali]